MPEPIVAVRDVLPTLGFVETWGTATDRQPAFAFSDGGIDMTAAEVMSIYLRPVFQVGGRANNGHQFSSIEAELPLCVESRDQVVAWLAHAVGSKFRPTTDVPWFTEGKALKHLLPWEKHYAQLRADAEARRTARQARPHCSVDRAWMRGICRRLRAVVESITDDDPRVFTVDFDGMVLKLMLPGEVLAAPAAGDGPWAHRIELPIVALKRLPKRLMTDPVEVGIWQGYLGIR